MVQVHMPDVLEVIMEDNIYVLKMRKEIPQACYVGMTGENLTIADFPAGVMVWLVDSRTINTMMLYTGKNLAYGFMGPHTISALPEVLRPFAPEGSDAVYTVIMDHDHQRINA